MILQNADTLTREAGYSYAKMLAVQPYTDNYNANQDAMTSYKQCFPDDQSKTMSRFINHITQIPQYHFQPLFLSTLPVAVEACAAFFATVPFFVAPAPVTPFLMVPMTVRFAGKGATPSLSEAAVVPFIGPFFTGADVLPSLDSETSLNLRTGLVVAAPLVESVPVAPAAFFPLADPLAELAVVEAEAVCFRAVAPVRVDRAFSAKLLKRLDALFCFTGDVWPAVVLAPGRETSGLPPGVVRGRGRTLGEDGDRTGWLRCFFSGFSDSVGLSRFSLLVLNVRLLRGMLVRRPIREGRRDSNLVCLGARPGPDLDEVAV